MKTFIRSGTVRRNSSLMLALTIGALSLVGASAHAATMDPIMISAPAIRVMNTMDRDSTTNLPIEEVTATAVVKFDPVTLTTNSGVALLKSGVRAAALQACEAADPLSLNYQSCLTQAVLSAQPQVDAVIAHARHKQNG